MIYSIISVPHFQKLSCTICRLKVPPEHRLRTRNSQWQNTVAQPVNFGKSWKRDISGIVRDYQIFRVALYLRKSNEVGVKVWMI